MLAGIIFLGCEKKGNTLLKKGEISRASIKLIIKPLHNNNSKASQLLKVLGKGIKKKLALEINN